MWFFSSSKKRKKSTGSESTAGPAPRPRQSPRQGTATHPTLSHNPNSSHSYQQQQQQQQHPPLPSWPPQQSRPRAQAQAPNQDQCRHQEQQHNLHQQYQRQQHHGHPPQQAIGLLTPPSGWTPPQQGAANAPPPYTAYHRPYQPIVVNQHYYLNPTTSAIAHAHKKASSPLGKFSNSVVNLTKDVAADVLPQLCDESLWAWQTYGTQLVGETAVLMDQISGRLNHIVTMIDAENVAGDERDLFAYHPPVAVAHGHGSYGGSNPTRSGKDRDNRPRRKGEKEKYHPKGQTSAVAASAVSGGYFAKVDMYANSRLPLDLPPLQLYVSTWPLICLAASYSERVYDMPNGAERDTHVDADWKSGTRAMVLKSVPMDDKGVVVFAIRGTASFMDWAVNLNMAPTSPVGFLDDPGNLCHAGFLTSAKKMLKPVASRLRQLLRENPGRTNHSLLITGHSAGGAVAALLYAHMHSTSPLARSELSDLAGSFKRIHCVTFGSPPVSVLPLGKPAGDGMKKSVFMSFINEGDPVARADKAYVKSLIELLASPEPSPPKVREREKKSTSSSKTVRKEKSRPALSSKKSQPSNKSSSSSSSSGSRWSPRSPTWRVPDCTLSNAGRIVVLRSGDIAVKVTGRKTVEERLADGVLACTAAERELRGVIWGDPVCHVMRLYSRRVEALAVQAITAKGR